MHLEFLVEEASSETALNSLVPKIVGDNVTFAIHPFNGKDDLLRNLLNRLKGYRPWIPEDYRIVVLIDEDRADCIELKGRLEKSAIDAGFITKTTRGEDIYHVLNRIAVEELEAWFFGDVQAIVMAYPRVPKSLGSREKYRNPDAIAGGTWETLERVLQRAGYYAAGMPKIEVARNISQHMIPENNKSKSFQVFRDALQEMTT